MSILLTLLLFAIGILLLIKGANWLVEGASAMARRLRVSDLVIGLTVVAFGTSMPELIVNIFASIHGNADIAIGNIVGSNIANMLLILGTTAVIMPLTIQRSTVIKEIPLSLLAAAALYIMANDALIDGYAVSEIGTGDGLILIGFFLIFLYYTFGMQRAQEESRSSNPGISLAKSLWMVFAGLIALSAGGKLSVQAAEQIALSLGVSEALVGLTVVAVGTSLPELMASMVAALKNKPDISVGNIVGSNIFNIFWILGISAVIKPLPFRPELNVDLVMVIVSAVLLFVMVHNGGMHRRLFLWWKQKKDYVLQRWEGAVLLGTYVLYIAFVAWRG